MSFFSDECLVCECSDLVACEPPCSWIAPGLCSGCLPTLILAKFLTEHDERLEGHGFLPVVIRAWLDGTRGALEDVTSNEHAQELTKMIVWAAARLGQGLLLNPRHGQIDLDICFRVEQMYPEKPSAGFMVAVENNLQASRDRDGS